MKKEPDSSVTTDNSSGTDNVLLDRWMPTIEMANHLQIRNLSIHKINYSKLGFIKFIVKVVQNQRCTKILKAHYMDGMLVNR